VFAPEWLADLRAELRRRIAETDPIDPGVAPPAAPWAEAVVPLLGLERRGAKLYEPGASAVVDEHAAAELESALELAGYEPVRVERGLGAVLEARGRLVLVGDGSAIGPAAYASARDALVAECETNGSITLARFRDLLGTSRRPAQLLLERFDADGLTRRVGDARVLRRRAKS
jgi:selenocysteine-specific elongation factor